MAVKTEPFDIGDDVVAYGDFENAAGVATTPTAGSLRVQKPDLSETPYDFATLDNPSVGRLEKTLRVDQAGRWYCNFTMTVAGKQVVREFVFQVRASQFPPLP